MPAQQLLLLLCRQSIQSLKILLTASPPRSLLERTRKLARAPLQHSRYRIPLTRAGDRGCLGHEVEVEELDELELDLAGGGAGFEEGGYGEEAVEGFESAGIEGVRDEGDDESEEGGGLNGRAVDRFEEVEEEL